jgi:hypothetical protein
MSGDAFGTPVRKLDFGKDVQLQGQERVVQSAPNMPTYLCWSRTDSMTTSATSAVYLPFTLPPLPAGSIVRAVGQAVCTTNGASTAYPALGVSGDWLVATPTAIEVASPGDFAAATQTGIFTLQAAVRGRNSIDSTSIMFSTSAPNLGAFTVTTVDCARSQRWAVYLSNANAISSTIGHVFVEVWIPRAYR